MVYNGILVLSVLVGSTRIETLLVQGNLGLSQNDTQSGTLLYRRHPRPIVYHPNVSAMSVADFQADMVSLNRPKELLIKLWKLSNRDQQKIRRRETPFYRLQTCAIF